MAEEFNYQTPYLYAYNNPLRFIDKNGKDGWDIVAGIVIGAVTNVVPGSTNLRNQYTPNDASDYNNSLRSTDASFIALGDGMQKGGGVAAVGGLAVAGAAAVATLAVVDAPVTIPAAGVGLAIAETGATVAVTGTLVKGNATLNMKKGYNYGKGTDGNSKKATDSSKNEKHGDNGRELTKSEKQINGYKEDLKTAAGNNKKKIQQKIKNVQRSALKSKKGIEDTNRGKRN